MVAVDIMVFAGIDPDAVHDAIRAGTGELHVPKPAASPRVPFDPTRWRSSH
jgi:hypothetical protein